MEVAGAALLAATLPMLPVPFAVAAVVASAAIIAALFLLPAKSREIGAPD